MKKITHNGIFRALCAVACAAAGTALAFLLVMMGIAVYGSFHGRTQEQITQLAMDRISGEKLCLMLDEMTAANVEVMAEEGEYPLYPAVL